MSFVDRTDLVAFSIYREFIAGGIGTRRHKRDQDGHLMWTIDRSGRRVPLEETPDEAAERRWFEAPEKTRESFRREASAAICAWERAA